MGDGFVFRCDDCGIAFRIHGHLAKHLRSKMHISVLEKEEKVPTGTYSQLEKADKLGELTQTIDTDLKVCIMGKLSLWGPILFEQVCKMCRAQHYYPC